MRRRFTSNKAFPINTDNYLTIEALEDGLKASLSTNVCEYCVDGDGIWKKLTAGYSTESINTGQTLSFKGELTSTSSDGIGHFSISKKCNLKGNCMSLLFGDNAADNSSLKETHSFYSLFYGCAKIINVSKDFLPATTLTDYCYESMFSSCTSLTTAPELPATTLAKNCYSYMFQNCYKLNYIKMLATDISARYCLASWVSGVSSTGTFVKNKNATWNVTGISGIPSGWTIQRV